MKKLLLIILTIMPIICRGQITEIFKADTLVQNVGFSGRMAYLLPTSSYMRGFNPQGESYSSSWSVYGLYGFEFSHNMLISRLYPGTRQGIGVAYTEFSCREIGQPVSLYVWQNTPILNPGKRWSLHGDWSFGATMGWKYHPSQIEHTVPVSSWANAYMNAGITLEYQATVHWILGLSGLWTHYSNGNTHLPNPGLNTLSGSINLTYVFNPQPWEYEAVSTEEWESFFGRRVAWDITVGGAERRKVVRESTGNAVLVPGSFKVASLSINPLWRWNRYFLIGGSLDMQYDESNNLQKHWDADAYHEFKEMKFTHRSLGDKLYAGVSLRAELSLPIFSVNLGIGHNLLYKDGDGKGWYQMFTLKTFITRNLYINTGYRLIRFKDPENLVIGLGVRI